MDTKFCTNCRTHQPLATGKHIWSGDVKRWKCINCLNVASTKSNMIKRGIARRQAEDKCATEIVTKEERVRVGEDI